MLQPTKHSPNEPNRSPSTPLQPDPRNDWNKKKKSMFFFFPEKDTAEGRPGHVPGDDKLDPDVAKPSRISPYRIRIRPHPIHAKIRAQMSCRHRQCISAISGELASSPNLPSPYKNAERSAVESFTFVVLIYTP
jgi:hypothetical protein